MKKTRVERLLDAVERRIDDTYGTPREWPTPTPAPTYRTEECGCTFSTTTGNPLTQCITHGHLGVPSVTRGEDQ